MTNFIERNITIPTKISVKGGLTSAMFMMILLSAAPLESPLRWRWPTNSTTGSLGDARTIATDTDVHLPLHSCFTCPQPCHTHLIILPSHMRWLKSRLAKQTSSDIWLSWDRLVLHNSSNIWPAFPLAPGTSEVLCCVADKVRVQNTARCVPHSDPEKASSPSGHHDLEARVRRVRG